MQIIKYDNQHYPYLQCLGNAAQFAIPYAKHMLFGKGYDIGCNRRDWAFPGAIPIDIIFDDDYHALNLPYGDIDYIFSSHCLEHIDPWVDVLNYWTKTLRKGGILFLYLPDFSQHYWRPWNNRKHKHILSENIIREYMLQYYTNIFSSGVDLNNSFMVAGEKK